MHTRGRQSGSRLVEPAWGTTHAHAGQTHLLTRYNARMSAKLYSVACIMQ